MRPREGSYAPCVSGSLRLAALDIKLAHSVFALPFAVLGAFLAAGTGGTGAEDGGAIAWGRFGGQLGLVVVCMVFARTWAMLFNRLVDARFDAMNPRTRGRAVASGALGIRRAWGLAACSALLFVVATAGFLALYGNPWPLTLSGAVLGWIAFYSLTKRFTALCHVFLGSALAVSPVAAAIAVEPSVMLSWPIGDVGRGVLLLAGFVMVWVAGFDVIYALQDLEFDRETGLHSVPSRCGWRGAIWVSRVLHGAGLVVLGLAVWVTPGLGVLTWIGVGLVAGLLAMEHVTLARRGKAGIPMAFFTYNGIVSCGLGVLGVVDVVV